MMPDEFYQEFPKLLNQYDEDRLLKAYIKRVLPKDAFHEIDADLRRLGERAVGDIYEWGRGGGKSTHPAEFRCLGTARGRHKNLEGLG
jgi:hypothetical protein